MRIDLQAVTHALAEDHGDGFVVGDEIVLNYPAAVKLLARPPWIHRPRTRLRRVIEETPVEVAGVRAKILHVNGAIRPELPLHVCAPLVLSSVRQVPRGRDDVRRTARPGDAERVI